VRGVVVFGCQKCHRGGGGTPTGMLQIKTPPGKRSEALKIDGSLS
jgi:hypothetical protein